MANIKSQIKRNRQNETRRLRNKAVMSDLKTAVKKVTTASEAGEDTTELFQAAQRKIDRAVSKGVIKGSTAARQKSRLARRIAG